MSWDDIENSQATEEQLKKARADAVEKQRSIAKKVNRLLTSEDGQEVLAHLTDRFIMSNHVDVNAKNINYEAAYKNGEAGVIHYLIHLIQQATHL